MQKQIEQVTQFHKVFNLYVADKISYPTSKIAEIRNKLIKEEFLEVSEELLHPHPYNMDRIAKELADLQYVLLGTVISYGLQDKFEEIFTAVHESNMSKLDVCPSATLEDGTCGHKMCNVFHRKPILREDGKVLKSKMYKEADVLSILNAKNTN